MKTATAPEATENSASTKTETPAAVERKLGTLGTGNTENVKREIPTTETRASSPAPKTEPRKMPSYYTPDLPDSEL